MGDVRETKREISHLWGDKESSVIDCIIISESKEHTIKKLKTEVRIESHHLPVVVTLEVTREK